jgi:hypothetical protein
VKTSDLIESLADGVEPVSRFTLAAGLARAIAAGGIVAFLAMWAWLGIRPDLGSAIQTADYWIKFGYTLALAGFGLWAAERLARPASRSRTAGFGIAGTALVLFVIAAVQYFRTAPSDRAVMVLGHSADLCPWRIAVLSLPIFVAALWSLRRLAPTRPVLAGAAAGFAAGALGAWIYAFHCNESAAPFILVFYSFGIALVTMAGAMLGRFILRW